MKQIPVFFLSCLLLAACQPAETPATVDANQAEKEIKEFFSQYHQANKNLDVAALDSLFSENSLFYGTDPSEFWSKQDILAEYQKLIDPENPIVDYTIDTQKIHLAADGQSAIVVEQGLIDWISPHIPLRWVVQLEKSGDSWLIVFSSVALIPANEDLPKINEAF